MKAKIRALIQRFGFDIIRCQKSGAPLYPSDFDKVDIEIYESVKTYTMTSPERVHALIESVKYIVKNKIDGAFVECGVWKGGSTMAMALMLKRLGVNNRDLYLYDTFSGMSTPSDADGTGAQDRYSQYPKLSDDVSTWCLSLIEEVKDNIYSTGYNKDKIHFIKGKVEDTIPSDIPKDIALLRLDTDWYESTKHELTHLFPRLKKNGVLIIDDYGCWEGARKAVDEYIIDNNICILLNRIDYTGRIAKKT